MKLKGMAKTSVEQEELVKTLPGVTDAGVQKGTLIMATTGPDAQVSVRTHMQMSS